MSYELKEYLKTINKTKENLMEGEDEMWEKKYPAFIVNKCLSPCYRQTKINETTAIVVCQ